MEPWPRLPGVRHLLHSGFPARHRRRRRLGRHRRRVEGPGDHAPASSAGPIKLSCRPIAPPTAANERAAAEAARHRAADPAADGRRARGAGRSRPARASRSATRKCAQRILADAGVPGERRSSSASSATSSCCAMQRPPMTAAEFEDNVRRSLDRREAARRRSPTGCRCPTRSSSRSTAAATTR